MRFALIISAFVALLGLVLWFAAGAYSAAQKRTVTYRYIGDALAPIPPALTRVTWDEPEVPLARPFSPVDARLIGTSLTEAWKAHAIAQQSGETKVLERRFAGVALERAEQSIDDALAHGGRMVVLSQHARPVFFHLDGSVFQAEVEMVVARFMTGDTADPTYEITHDRGIFTLLNEANGWRVFSYERRAVEPVVTEPAPWRGTMKGVNYYPSATPWRDFWPTFDLQTIAEDFDLLRDLDADSVRIFLTRETFIRDDYETALENLSDMLALAEQKGLRVVPTLFDLKGDYNLSGWTDDALFLERVMPTLAAAPAVAFVDVKNEPDLDFTYHGEETVLAWIKSMVAVSRSLAPDMPLTVGWASAEAAKDYLLDFDVITYHDYAPIDGAGDRLAEVQLLAGDAPVVVTEIGETDYTALLGFPSSQTAQANRLHARLSALAGADGVMVWTLYDFPTVDPGVVGSSPWVRRLQARFGMIMADGTEKPAADVFRSAAFPIR
ncbi:hypothetical protein [Celeribacter arenosi]|uniref:Cellulase family glycosylhydrolase n=1 Tax=Celeribacter arenosi TaxID=792649 RepID=A0ABP7K1X1_9RHOB